MSEKLKVTLDDVKRSAKQIQQKNQYMNDGFNDVDKALNVDLSSNMEGNIKNHILGSFDYMKNAYVERRYNYLDAYQKYLIADVSHNYKDVEKANKEAVDYLR